MAHLFQVGAGSGGMTALDILSRDAGISQVTLVEPDDYKPHNVIRHLFPNAWVGGKKADLAKKWIHERRPYLDVDVIIGELQSAALAPAIDIAVQACDIAVCAADNEPAKFHFDALMRQHRKPWTLGEVLSGGIGGFVHWFTPKGPCYGCVVSFLRRSVAVDASKPPDYSAPNGPAPETTIPASRASIEMIASLHAQVTLQLIGAGPAFDPGFTTMLWTLEKVPGVFEAPFRAHRFRIPRAPDCLICGAENTNRDLGAALDEAITRLNNR